MLFPYVFEDGRICFLAGVFCCFRWDVSVSQYSSASEIPFFGVPASGFLASGSMCAGKSFVDKLILIGFVARGNCIEANGRRMLRSNKTKRLKHKIMQEHNSSCENFIWELGPSPNSFSQKMYDVLCLMHEKGTKHSYA